MSKAMLVMDMPKNCGNCDFIRNYEDGAFSRNPHCCCELIWFLEEEDYRVNPNSLDKNCPLREVPQKQSLNGTLSEFQKGVRSGYNACIDEIMKGSEENG